MSFSLFKPKYRRRWQVIISKFGKELYNKIYNAATYMLDIKNKIAWSTDYKYEVIATENGFNSYYRFNNGIIVSIINIKEEI